MKQNYVISVDWLQVFCTGHRPPIEIPSGDFDGKPFWLRLRSYGSSLWCKIADVVWNDWEVAEICWCPRSSAIRSDAFSVRLTNRVLYSQKFMSLLAEIIGHYELTYQGITRIDVCYDCNLLKDERKVPWLIREYLFAQPSQEGHIIRKGSNRFEVFGKRAQDGATEYTAIRFGSKNSNIGAYAYNKSLELLEVKDKPWIREVWEKNGLVHETRYDEWAALKEFERNRHINSGSSTSFVHTPVWRFEISIKSEGRDLLSVVDGDLQKLGLDFLTSYEKIKSIFFMYAEKVFNFSMSTGQKRRRYYPRLDIFEDCAFSPIVPVAINRNAGTGRIERICYNKLQNLCNTYHDIPHTTRQGLNEAMQFLLYVANVKDSTIRTLRVANYLNEMNCKKWLGSLDEAYSDAMHNVQHAKDLCHQLAQEEYWASMIEDLTAEFLRPIDPPPFPSELISET